MLGSSSATSTSGRSSAMARPPQRFEHWHVARGKQGFSPPWRQGAPRGAKSEERLCHPERGEEPRRLGQSGMNEIPRCARDDKKALASSWCLGGQERSVT